MLERELELQARIDALETQLAQMQKRYRENRYGLHWIDVPEAFDDDAENKLPVLEEIKEFAIHNDDGKPTHVLIEGDNYHALTCLNYTHKEKIDVIYIDPPYNTGSDKFRYKDKRVLNRYPDGAEVPKNHPMRHSYWLSFMHKRLELAKNLMKDTGVIFISIDQNEVAQLKLLCDGIFKEENFIGLISNINNPKGRSDDKYFATANEFLLVYKKNNLTLKGWKPQENILKRYNKVDELGISYREIDLRKTGDNDRREDRENLFYYFYYNQSTKDLYISREDEIAMGYIQIKPTRDDGSEGNWRWEISTAEKNWDKLIPKFMPVRKKWTIFEKDDYTDDKQVKPTTAWTHKEVNSERGTEQFLDFGFEKNQFPKPKPTGLIKSIIELIPNENCIVLDFFVGSGTTFQAVIEKNKEDYGNRQAICITNNENNLCQEVTFKRVENLIKGYDSLKNGYIEGIGNSLKYYKTTFVGENNVENITDDDKVELAQKAGCLLALSENTLEEIVTTKYFQLFLNSKKEYLTAVYFKEIPIYLDDFYEKVIAYNLPTTVFIFSWEEKGEHENMFGNFKNIVVKTIPIPIINIYNKIFNLKPTFDIEEGSSIDYRAFL